MAPEGSAGIGPETALYAPLSAQHPAQRLPVTPQPVYGASSADSQEAR